jgi:methylthioribose-1-phosphate isomerase
VTPAALVSAIITEAGILERPDRPGVLGLLAAKSPR